VKCHSRVGPEQIEYSACVPDSSDTRVAMTELHYDRLMLDKDRMRPIGSRTHPWLVVKTVQEPRPAVGVAPDLRPG
jgi:hypothetical protein